MTRKYEFPLFPSEDLLMSLSYEHEVYSRREAKTEQARQKLLNQAVEFLHLRLKYYPESPEVSQRIEHLYREMGKPEEEKSLEE
jgi:hypothetical protein